MNFAENLLFSRDKTKTSSTRCTTGKEDNKTVFTEVREGCTEIRDITWKDLRKEVGRLANAMKAHGVGKGDRVMVVMSNSIVTAEIWLAAATIGAIFSSSSTDMGVKGVLQRALQIEPKVSDKLECGRGSIDRASTFSWTILPFITARRST